MSWYSYEELKTGEVRCNRCNVLIEDIPKHRLYNLPHFIIRTEDNFYILCEDCINYWESFLRPIGMRDALKIVQLEEENRKLKEQLEEEKA